MLVAIAVRLLAASAMIAAPFVLVLALRRRWGATSIPWSLVGAGALTFVASQVVHVPLLLALTAVFARWHPRLVVEHKLGFNAVILGLAAGVCEEGARFVALRVWLRRHRGFRAGVAFGAGHGGCEAALLGALAGLTLVAMTALHAGVLPIPPAKVAVVAEAVAKYWDAPAWQLLVGPLERLSALALHVAAASLVMASLTRAATWPLVAAITLHAVVDGASVWLVATHGVAVTEGVVACFGVVSLGVIAWCRSARGSAR